MIQFDLIAMRHTASGEHEFKYLVTGITDFTDETDLLKKNQTGFYGIAVLSVCSRR